MFQVHPPDSKFHVTTEVPVTSIALDEGTETTRYIRVHVDDRGIAHHPVSKVMAMCLYAPVPEDTVEMRLTVDEAGRLVLIAGVDNFAGVEVDPAAPPTYPAIVTYAYVFTDGGWNEIQRPDPDYICPRDEVPTT
jgi:hypothetical protein